MSFTSERTRWSDVAIAATAQFFGALGMFLVNVTLLLAVQRAGGSGWQVSVLAISEVLPIVLLGKPIGRVIDRFDSRKLLVISGIGQVLACLFLAGTDRYWAIVGGAIALGAATAIAIPTRQALLPAIAARDDLPKANAVGQTAGSAGMTLGPALAGLMVGAYGPRPTVLLAAVGFTATIAGGLLIRTRRGGRPADAAAEATAAAPTPDPEWTLRSDRLLWSSVWALTAVMCTLSAVNVVLVFFIMRTLHSTEALYGVVDSMWTVGLAIGAWLFSRLIRPTTGDPALARGVLLMLAGIAVAVVLVGLAPAALWIIPCYLLGGTGNGGLNVFTGTLVGRRAPAASRGRANTTLTMRVQAGAMIGYVAGGVLLAVADPRWVVIGCGVLGLVTALTAAAVLRRSPSAPVAIMPQAAAPALGTATTP
jgi:MFS family permease